MGIAIRDGHWLVSVDRRITKVEFNTHTYVSPTTIIYTDDWYRRARPAVVWRDAYWTYNTAFNTGGLGGVNAVASASWSADNPMLISGTNTGSVNGAGSSSANFTVTSN